MVSDFDNTVVKVYSDVNSSGLHWNRPALKSLIKDVESGLIDKVVIADVSRVSRSGILYHSIGYYQITALF